VQSTEALVAQLLRLHLDEVGQALQHELALALDELGEALDKTALPRPAELGTLIRSFSVPAVALTQRKQGENRVSAGHLGKGAASFNMDINI